MTHMVIFRSPEGKPGYHQAEGLDEAMRFAEMLRNQEQVTDARIFRMDEVPIEFKVYFRVEMASAAGSGDMASAAGSGDMASAAGSGEVDERVSEDAEVLGADDAPEAAEEASTATAEDGEPEPMEAGVSGSGRYGLFSRG